MKVIIVKKIETEIRDIRPSPIYREVIPMFGILTAKDGEMPPEQICTNREKTYEQMRIWNPDTKEFTYYYVNVDERHLWNDLVMVSDGFIQQRVNERVEEWKDKIIPRVESEFYDGGYNQAIRRIKAISWYKRLFNKF